MRVYAGPTRGIAIQEWGDKLTVLGPPLFVKFDLTRKSLVDGGRDRGFLLIDAE